MSPGEGAPIVAQVGASRVSVGRFTYGTEHLSIRQWGEGAALTIGSFCSISSAVTIFLGGNHRTDWVTTFPFGHIYQEQLGGVGIPGHPATAGDVTIGHDVWIGHGVTIMSGITIGSGAVLAANANVVADVAPYEIVGGNPAKHIRDRFEPAVREMLLELRWWDWPLDTIRRRAPQLCTAPRAEVLQEWLADRA